ncbi:MAG TPA: EamA family transporter [Aggregatilineales bacterium]|nr:EamA family transporter [Chloroflexota bacterium]HPV08540.1 EamA family transporter [Aggregatilineales bacterium]HQA69842.1 EamA family transporter [Aggregatilineales bacterium]HQE19222.1 EamA family transporter [Aggregatilineales bacterium]
MDTTVPATRQASGYVLVAFIATVFWSTTAIFIRHLTEQQLPPLVLAFWRDLLVTLAMVAALAIVQPKLLRVPGRHIPFFVLYGFVLMAFNGTWTVSVDLNGAAVSTVLAYSSPAITAILAWLLWRESLGWVKIASVLLSLGGCVLVSGAYDLTVWQLNSAGVIVGVASGVLFAVYNICGKESARRGVNSWSALMLTFGVASVFLLIVLHVPLPVVSDFGHGADLLHLGSNWAGWGVLLLLAWGPTLAGYGLYTLSLSSLPASVASLIASLEPALTAALAFVLLGERLTVPQLIGSTMIIFGVVLLQWESAAAARRTPQVK